MLSHIASILYGTTVFALYRSVQVTCAPAARSRDGASPIVRGMEREREIPEIFLQKMILINAVVLFMHQSVDLSIAL